MFPTLIPAAIAFLTSSTMPAPYSGWVMIASYLPDPVASWSCLTWSAGTRLASKTVRLALPAAAAAFAAASIGASELWAPANDGWAIRGVCAAARGAPGPPAALGGAADGAATDG